MIRGAHRTLCTAAIFAATLAGSVAHAAWPNDPSVNVPISTAAADQAMPAICSDGAGGAIIVWIDKRDTLASRVDVYARRVNAAGVPLWTADGVAICTAPNDQGAPSIAPDGAGGAIIAWQDSRGTSIDVYAQRVDAAGVPQWTANGVAISSAAGHQVHPAIASDGAGGAIVTWYDYRGGSAADIYAQRVNAAGVPQWTPDGVALCTAAGSQYFPAIAADGAGGAIVAWEDVRSGSSYDIYAQRVDGAGAPQWTPDGVALSTAAYDQRFPSIASDGAGGAIVAWNGGSSSGYDIYAQRVSAAGAPEWTANGVALCAAAGNQFNPAIIADGAGGAILGWQDNRSATNYDAYAQRVNAAGLPPWTQDGVALSGAPGYESNVGIVTDGAGGAIVTWDDNRSGSHIYARRVNGSGTPQWTADGVALSTAPGGQFNPAIVADGAGGAIVTWDDVRSGADRDIYAQNVNADGSLGGTVVSVPPSPSASFALRQAGPNPSPGALRVSFSLPDGTPAVLELYDLTGRRLESVAVGGLGPGAHVVALAARAHALAPGIYTVSLTQGGRRAFRKVAIVR